MQRNPLQAAVAGVLALGLSGPLAAACAPCTPKKRSPCSARRNPCAGKGSAPSQNPCAAKNPCAGKNPCAASGKVDRSLVMRPKGTRLTAGDVALGEKLWNDTKLSTNGSACSTCHSGGAAFAASFAKPFPHRVGMAASRAGVRSVSLDEMVQFCLVVPMATKPLAWDSKELASLTAYTGEVQQQFIRTAAAGAKAAPCAAAKRRAGNPCAPAIPRAASNPCKPNNPCAAKNPCAPKANPCAAARKS